MKFYIYLFLAFFNINTVYTKSLCDSYTEPHVQIRKACYVQFSSSTGHHADDRKACEAIGNSHLAFIRTKEELDAIAAAIKFPDWGHNIGLVQVSKDDEPAGNFRWVSSVGEIYAEDIMWGPNKPKNLNNNQDCGIAMPDGIYDGACDVSRGSPRGYICQINIQDPCDMFDEAHVQIKNVCYVQFSSATGHYADDRKACEAIGNSHLAFIRTKEELDAIEAGIKFPNWGHNIGLLQVSKDDEPAGNWRWVNSVGEIYAENVMWGPTKPKNLNNNQDCGIAMPDGIYDGACDVSRGSPRGYICQINLDPCA